MTSTAAVGKLSGYGRMTIEVAFDVMRGFGLYALMTIDQWESSLAKLYHSYSHFLPQWLLCFPASYT